jgi:hypothetical protein
MERYHKLLIESMIVLSFLSAVYSLVDYSLRSNIFDLCFGLGSTAFQMFAAYGYWIDVQRDDFFERQIADMLAGEPQGGVPPSLRGVMVGFFRPRLARWYHLPLWVHFLTMLALAISSVLTLVYVDSRLTVVVPVSIAVFSLYQRQLRKWLRSVFAEPRK